VVKEDIKLTQLSKTVQWFVHRAEEAAQYGDIFPIWGICLGHEEIMLSFEPKAGTIQRLDTNLTYDTYLPVITKHAYNNPKTFFYGLSNDLKTAMRSERLFYYHHKFGIAKDWYEQSDALKTRFAPVAYGIDNKGRHFLAAYQHRHLPIFGCQFHPEKNQFEWKTDSNRQPHGLEISHHMAMHFHDVVRQNGHSFKDKNELKMRGIYNYEQSNESAAFASIFVIPKIDKTSQC